MRTGQSQTDFLADQSRIGAARGISAQQDQQNRKQGLKTQKVKLKAEKGDYAVQYRATARANERTAQATDVALGIKQQSADTAQTNAQNTKAYHDSVIANQQRGMNQKDAIFAAQKQHHTGPFAPANRDTPAGRLARKRDRAQQANHTGPYAPAKGKPSHTKSERRTAANQYDTGVSLLRQSPKATRGKSTQELIDLLISQHLPGDIARAAVLTRNTGGVPNHLRRHLQHKYGFTPPGKQRLPKNKNPFN